MENKDKISIERIEAEIAKIVNKENSIYFFVLDTKGNPSGSLEYIYKLALILNDNGYNVTMLYQKEADDEFVGVGDWLGEKYANLKHSDISNEDVGVSPSDILFIPEIFSNIMIQTKKLPCKRIAILQNYDYILEQMPLSSQWGDLGILECISNTDVNSELLKEIFPYVKTTVVEPYIDEMFGETNEHKKLIVNIVGKYQGDINKIIKPFYWKYPVYKWISFRDLRGFPKEIYSKYLRESAITVWADDETSFGYSALEAMKSCSIVLAKRPEMLQRWMVNDEGNNLSDCCVWFDSFHELHNMLSSVIRALITYNVPKEIFEAAEKSVSKYSYESTKDSILSFIGGIMEGRKNEMESLITHIKTKS